MLTLRVPAVATALLAASVAVAGSTTVEIPATADTSIFEDLPNSNGAGSDLFVGQTGSIGGAVEQRSLVRFDLDGLVPDGATITSATFELFLTQAGPASVPTDHSIRRLLNDWGEAGSTANGGQGDSAEPGDATWEDRFFPGDAWDTAGGDAVAAASATVNIANIPGSYAFTGDAVADDVQAWLDDPKSNFGWLVVSENPINFNARKFGARENGVESRRPVLVVTYELGGGDCPADFDGDETVGFADLLSLLANWGDCDGCAQDIDESGAVDFNDLLTLLAAWGAC